MIQITSPLRVNLIGEHTDYNQGFVLPMCIELATKLNFTPREDSKIVIKNSNFGEFSVDLNSLSLSTQPSDQPPPDAFKNLPSWHQHIFAMIFSLQEAGFKLKKGFEGEIFSEAPIGAGLSSSTAFELAIARALLLSNDSSLNTGKFFAWDNLQIAKLSQRAENHWIGVKCGLMDQLVCTHAIKNHACLIDCENLEITPIPIPNSLAIVILDTQTRRGLVESKYNQRREQCEMAAKTLHTESLRQVSLEMLLQAKTVLSKIHPDIFHRAHHVITENQRVLSAVNALRNNQPKALGKLFNQSHQSLDQDFQVTNAELNLIVQIAQKTPGCYGARMTGAGFGGCAVALVQNQPDVLDHFLSIVSQEYFLKSGLHCRLYFTRPTQGCHHETLF